MNQQPQFPPEYSKSETFRRQEGEERMNEGEFLKTIIEVLHAADISDVKDLEERIRACLYTTLLTNSYDPSKTLRELEASYKNASPSSSSGLPQETLEERFLFLHAVVETALEEIEHEEKEAQARSKEILEKIKDL